MLIIENPVAFGFGAPVQSCCFVVLSSERYGGGGDSPTVRGPSPGHDHTIRRRALDPWHPGSPGSLSLSSCVVGDNIDDDQAEEHSSIPEKDRQGLSDSPVSAKAQTFTSTESGAYAAYSAINKKFN